MSTQNIAVKTASADNAADVMVEFKIHFFDDSPHNSEGLDEDRVQFRLVSAGTKQNGQDFLTNFPAEDFSGLSIENDGEEGQVQGLLPYPYYRGAGMNFSPQQYSIEMLNIDQMKVSALVFDWDQTLTTTNGMVLGGENDLVSCLTKLKENGWIPNSWDIQTLAKFYLHDPSNPNRVENLADFLQYAQDEKEIPIFILTANSLGNPPKNQILHEIIYNACGVNIPVEHIIRAGYSHGAEVLPNGTKADVIHNIIIPIVDAHWDAIEDGAQDVQSGGGARRKTHLRRYGYRRGGGRRKTRKQRGGVIDLLQQGEMMQNSTYITGEKINKIIQFLHLHFSESPSGLGALVPLLPYEMMQNSTYITGGKINKIIKFLHLRFSKSLSGLGPLVPLLPYEMMQNSTYITGGKINKIIKLLNNITTPRKKPPKSARKTGKYSKKRHPPPTDDGGGGNNSDDWKGEMPLFHNIKGGKRRKTRKQRGGVKFGARVNRPANGWSASDFNDGEIILISSIFSRIGGAIGQPMTLLQGQVSGTGRTPGGILLVNFTQNLGGWAGDVDNLTQYSIKDVWYEENSARYQRQKKPPKSAMKTSGKHSKKRHPPPTDDGGGGNTYDTMGLGRLFSQAGGKRRRTRKKRGGAPFGDFNVGLRVLLTAEGIAYESYTTFDVSDWIGTVIYSNDDPVPEVEVRWDNHDGFIKNEFYSNVNMSGGDFLPIKFIYKQKKRPKSARKKPKNPSKGKRSTRPPVIPTNILGEHIPSSFNHPPPKGGRRKTRKKRGGVYTGPGGDIFKVGGIVKFSRVAFDFWGISATNLVNDAQLFNELRGIITIANNNRVVVKWPNGRSQIYHDRNLGHAPNSYPTTHIIPVANPQSGPELHGGRRRRKTRKKRGGVTIRNLGRDFNKNDFKVGQKIDIHPKPGRWTGHPSWRNNLTVMRVENEYLVWSRAARRGEFRGITPFQSIDAVRPSVVRPSGKKPPKSARKSGKPSKGPTSTGDGGRNNSDDWKGEMPLFHNIKGGERKKTRKQHGGKLYEMIFKTMNGAEIKLKFSSRPVVKRGETKFIIMRDTTVKELFEIIAKHLNVLHKEKLLPFPVPKGGHTLTLITKVGDTPTKFTLGEIEITRHDGFRAVGLVNDHIEGRGLDLLKGETIVYIEGPSASWPSRPFHYINGGRRKTRKQRSENKYPSRLIF